MKSFSFTDLFVNYSDYIFIDVRSPGEYLRGHIPGAQNIPLLSDQLRHIIGIEYKQKGRESAILKGLAAIGPHLPLLVEQAKNIKKDSHKTFCIYCARGGMRSRSIAWLFSLFKLPVVLLTGGYKNFRNWGIKQLDCPKKIVILAGKTGAGKTEMLQLLAQRNWPVINLEKLAKHKGSVFGGTKETQATQQQFENDLAFQWAQCSDEKPVVIEDESRKIGAIIIPENIWKQMQRGTLYYLDIDYQTRLDRIMKEYGSLDISFLLHATTIIAQQLGGAQFKAIYNSQDNRRKAASLLLDYYDRKYHFGSEFKTQYRFQKIEELEKLLVTHEK